MVGPARYPFSAQTWLEFGQIRAFGSTPAQWLVQGYVQAASRFRDAAARGPDTARDVFIPLFEAMAWAHSIWDTRLRPVDSADERLQALRFVRNRCHHQLASAIHFDAAAGAWCWYPIENLPPEDAERRPDSSGAELYTQLLAGRDRHSRAPAGGRSRGRPSGRPRKAKLFRSHRAGVGERVMPPVKLKRAARVRAKEAAVIQVGEHPVEWHKPSSATAARANWSPWPKRCQAQPSDVTCLIRPSERPRLTTRSPWSRAPPD